MIAKHNQLYATGEKSYELALNEFADMLHGEFLEAMTGLNITVSEKSKDEGATFIPPANVKIPNTVDWRNQGAVTDVKNQGRCGSCWAFSATGSLEGRHFRKTGILTSLSEQNLIDCSRRWGNNGCRGGLMDNAFRYIKDNRGVDIEISYPYKASDDNCHFNPKTVGATDYGFVDIPSGNEQQLQSAVATVGPISVAIDASWPTFQFYSSGVYNEPSCSTSRLNHGVLAVGYGNFNGRDYWLVKNSWGKSWGNKGYIMMSRNQRNQCGISTMASYPLV